MLGVLCVLGALEVLEVLGVVGSDWMWSGASGGAGSAGVLRFCPRALALALFSSAGHWRLGAHQTQLNHNVEKCRENQGYDFLGATVIRKQ